MAKKILCVSDGKLCVSDSKACVAECSGVSCYYGDLAIGGHFQHPVGGITTWNGAISSYYDDSLSDSGSNCCRQLFYSPDTYDIAFVEGLCWDNNGDKLYVVGRFDKICYSQSLHETGCDDAYGFVIWDTELEEWLNPLGTITTDPWGDLLVNGHLNFQAAELYDNKIFLFQNLGTVKRLCYWDTITESFTTLGEIDDYLHRIKKVNGELYFCGEFENICGTSATGLARYSNGSFIDMGLNQKVSDICSGPNGLLVTGDAISEGSAGAWNQVGYYVSLESSWYRSRSSCIADNAGNVFISGVRYFKNSSEEETATNANGIAMWNGSTLSTVGGGLGLSGNRINVFELDNNGILYAAGLAMKPPGFSDDCSVIRWDGYNWMPVGSVGFGGSSGSDTFVVDMEFRPGGTLQDWCYEWDAYYNCETEAWEVSYAGKATDCTSTSWTYVEDGYYTCKTGTDKVPPSPPAVTPTCYYTWEANYNCTTLSWSVSLASTNFSGSTSSWSGCDDGQCTCVTTSSTPPSAPTNTPTCYYTWEATYDCSSSSWSVDFVSVSLSGTPAAWTGCEDGYCTCVTTSDSTPSDPTTTPTCYYYWYAYYDCYSSTWYVDLMWIDSSGSASGWDCMLMEDWNECYCTTTSATQPADPTETPLCS